MKNIIKRITILVMCVMMIFASCFNTYAYGSRPQPSNIWSNYYTYVEVYDTLSNPYATAYINLGGMTHDMEAYISASVLYSDQSWENSRYSTIFESKTLAEANVNNLPEGYIKRFTELTTDPLEIHEDSTLMHTYAYSWVELSNYEYDIDGVLICDDFVSETDCVHSSDHIEDDCDICMDFLSDPD